MRAFFHLTIPLALLASACEPVPDPVAPLGVSARQLGPTSTPPSVGGGADPAPTFAVTSDWTDVRLDLPAGDIKFYAPCVDDWFDEVGSYIQSIHTVTTDDGSLFYIKFRSLEGFRIVGDRTGNWNLGVPIQQASWVERIPKGTGSYSFNFSLNPYLYVNEVSGIKMNWPLLVKVTINANGQLTVNRESFLCKILGK